MRGERKSGGSTVEERKEEMKCKGEGGMHQKRGIEDKSHGCSKREGDTVDSHREIESPEACIFDLPTESITDFESSFTRFIPCSPAVSVLSGCRLKVIPWLK